MPLVAAPLVLVSACDDNALFNNDIFDVDVPLAAHAYQADFGPDNGTVPTIECQASMPAGCASGQTLATTIGDGSPAGADVSVQVGCDAALSRCFAQGRVRLAYQLDVLQDDAFTTKVERRAVSIVREVDLAYTVPTNTLTFDLPKIDLYVGPAGTKSETDPGVVLVDSVAVIHKGETFADDERHLTLAAGSPARALLEQHIKAKQPFVFVLATSPRLEAGDPLPGGGFDIVVQPTLSLGLED